MIPYASATGEGENLDTLREAGWRLLVSAADLRSAKGFQYGLDNGAWSAFQKKQPFDEKKFAQALARMGDRADWVVVPDIVEGGMASLDYSCSWMERVLSATPMALLAVQDGMVPADVAGFLGGRTGLFVGGSTEWKKKTMGQWCHLATRAGCWAHVGRVNSQRRIKMCHDAGATSFDGSSASKWSKTCRRLTSATKQGSLYYPLKDK